MPPAAVIDTLSHSVADTVVVKVPRRHTIHRDTADETNWIFSRKKPVIYDPKLLVGEWLRDTEHEVYFADSTGMRWDTSDDIMREEAQVFRWTMDSNSLTIKYTLTFGALMIRQYEVTFVDDETLVYRDAFDDSYMWEKVVVPNDSIAIP